MPDEKEPIPKFAARIKAKYPEYKDVDDTLLTQRIVEKYPEYGAMVDMSGIAQSVKKKESTSAGTGGDGLSPFSYDNIQQKEDPNRFIKPNYTQPAERENYAQKYEENQAAAANTEKYPGTLRYDMAIEAAERDKGEFITLQRDQTSLPHMAGISLGGNINVSRKQYIDEQKKLRDDVLRQNSTLKANADKALKDVKGNLERNIEYVTTNINDFTETSGEGDKIPAKFKINDYAKKKALQHGVSDEGHYKNLLYNEIIANVTHKIIEPKVIEKFNENYKKKYGKTPEEETTEEAVKGFTKDEQIIGKAKIQVQAINEEISKSAKEEVDALNVAVNQEAANIKAQYEANSKLVQNEEQAKELHGEATAAISKLNEDFLKQQNAINSKYNARYRRQTEEIAKIANAKIQEESQKYKYKRSPDLQKRIETEYRTAYSEVVKGNQEMLEKRDASLPAVVNFGRTFITSLGGAIKGLSSSMDFDTGKVFGDYLSGLSQHGSTELKNFSDFLDATKLSKSMGQLAGGMTPALVAAGGTTIATGGAGAPAVVRMLAGGVASWSAETAQLAGNMYEDKFAETGNAALAENAAKQTVDSQVLLMPLYAFDGLPFVGKSLKLAKNIPARILLGGTIELGAEFLQEYPQNLFEEAIKNDKPYMEGLKLSSLERAKNTFLNIATTFLLGGGGQAVGVINEKRDNALAKSAAKSFALKSDFTKIAPDMQNQFIFDIMQRKGKSFTTAYVGALFSNGTIDETQSAKLLGTIKLSETVISNSEKYGLTPAIQKVYGSFALKRAEALSLAETENDPILKMAAEKNVRDIENDMVSIASGEKTDYTVVTLPNNEQYVLTQKEAEKAMDDVVFTESYANGDIKVQTYGKRSIVQERLDEIDAEKAKPKQEINPEEVITKAAEDGVFGSLGEMVTSGQITPKQAVLELAMQKYGVLGDGSESPTGGRDISMKTSLDVDEAVTKMFPTKESVQEAIKGEPSPSMKTQAQPEGAAEGVAPSTFDGKTILGSDLDLRGKKKKSWMRKNALDKININDINEEGHNNTLSAAIENVKSGKKSQTKESPLVEIDEQGNATIIDGHHRIAEDILNGKTHIEALVDNKFNIRDAIKNGEYQKAISEGAMSANDAKDIIESARLSVPKDIIELAANEKAKTTQVPNETKATGAATGTTIEAGKETKKSNRKALSDELRSLLGEGLPFKDVSNKDIKEGGSKNIEEYNQRAERVLKTLYPNAEFKAFSTTKEYEQATGRKGEAGVLIRGKEGKHQLFLNLEAIINSDIERTATHEVVHALVSDAIGVKYADLRKKWDNLLPKLYGVKGFEIVKEHIEKYSSADRPVEGITDLLANIVHGKIKIEDVPKNLLDEFIELVNRAFEAIGIDYKITPDTFNGFASSVKEAFETGDFSSLKKFTSKGKTEKFFKEYPEFAESASAMADPEKRKKLISDFIKSSFEKGASEEDIKGALIDNGLTETEAKSFIDSNKPPKAPDETEEEFQNKPKSILNRLFNSNNVSQKVKNDFEKEGLTYEPQSHEQARRIAGEIISEFGVENSITMAESGRFSGDVNSMIFAEGIDRTFQFEQAVASVDEKIELAEQWADYAIRYDKAARESGRFISAIYDFYRKSPLGVIISERRKREEAFKEWFDKREKPYKEVFDALQEEPDFKEMLKTKVETQLKQERAVFRMKRRKKISDLFDGAKIGNQGINSSIIPPQIWNAAVEVMKQATLAGESIASVIETGVKYIKDNNKDAWDEKAFRDEWGDKLSGIDKEGKIELTSEEKKQRILDRFRKKLNGLSEEQKEDVIRKSFKKLVEAGALEYDDFKKIVADVIGLGELTAEETAKMTGFIKDMNAVQDLSDALIKDESKEALKAFESGVKKAEESATKLAAMLYTKPKVAQRLRSIIQLNTLGVVSLIKNPFYNIFHQMLVRLPKGVVMTILDQSIYGASLLGNKAFGSPIIKPDVNILLAQRGYFGKGAKGGAEAVKQVFTGLTNKDYFQKEVYNSQIKPFSSWRDLWAWGKGKKNLSKGQIADKALQGTLGIPAEAVARMLNIGDKPFRFAAEAAIAKTIGQQQLGLKGFELDVFMRLPKEKAKQIFIKKGFTEDQANKKAEEIEKRIVAEGEEAVFQQNNIVADVINKVKQALPSGDEDHPLSSVGSGAAKLFGLLNMPFVKTPANIAWEVFNLVNPEFALGQALVYGVRAARTNSKSDFLRAKKWMAHAATGWALLGAAGYLASIGAVSGDDEDEPYKPKESKGKGTYEKPHSVNLSKLMRGIAGDSIDTADDDLNVDLSWFGAMGMIMNMQANKYENMSKEERENMAYVDDVLFRLNRGAQDGLVNSVFSGSLTAVDAIRSGRHDQWLLGMLNVGMNAVEPATIAQLSRATRPYDYKITGDDLSETLMNNLKSRTFGVIGNPKSKVNVWGEPMKREGTVSDVTLRMLGISKSDTDKFATPLFEEFKKTGNANFFPPAISPRITVDGEERRLNSEQLLQYETLVGQSRRNLVDPFINNAATIKGKRYNKMNEEQKIEALKSLYSKGYNSGKKIFIQLHPEFKSKK